MEQINHSKTLGDVLKHYIAQSGKTQSQLSVETGIPRNSLNRKLNGGVFSYPELILMASALGKHLSEIFKNVEQHEQGLVA
jgi:transcriptional regulator with XRE-family HTH domain